MNPKILVVSAPSGGGKSVVAKHILSHFPQFGFSVSATTRNKRNHEISGEHYYFVTKEDFKSKIAKNEFIEYEEIFGNYYGTPKSEIEKLLSNNRYPLFDIDVKGAYSIKKHYGASSVLIFLKPPSIEVLQNRLKNRNTETSEQLNIRLKRAEMEINACTNFDYILINDNLNTLLLEIESIIKERFPVAK